MRYQDTSDFKNNCGYEINGVWFPRVTKILDIKSKPALDSFFREMESYSSAEEVKNRSAVYGTLIHDAVQKTLIGEPVLISEEIRPAVEAFKEFNKTRNIFFHPGFVERRIWSNRHKYSGTIDALATVDGKFGVLDIKTSIGFYPEYNLQTAAYVSALQEFEIKKTLSLPADIQTRWILRIDQRHPCKLCGAFLRTKGGRNKIRTGKSATAVCRESEHKWGEAEGDIELKEFPYFFKDIRAFMAAKVLWEWENDYWLRQVGYLR